MANGTRLVLHNPAVSLKSHLIILASILRLHPPRLLKYVVTDCNGSSPRLVAPSKKKLSNGSLPLKQICNSANSEVQWSKNSKEPVGAFTTMRAGLASR